MGLLGQGDWQGAAWIGAADSSTQLGYAAESATADAVKWVQVDLGGEVPLDSVVIRPQYHNDPGAGGWVAGYGFPLRFKVEVSNIPDFSSATTVADHTDADFANPGIRRFHSMPPARAPATSASPPPSSGSVARA